MSAAPRTTWWGWHRLTDDWARRLVARAHIEPGDLVLDIGAGTGAITSRLVDAGARVLAVEMHPGRAGELRRRFAGHPVTVVQRDAAQLHLPRQQFHVVANPPFAITTALLRRLLDPRGGLQRAELVLPRHAAVRWASGRGRDVGRWSTTYGVTLAGRVPRSAFLPMPQDDAAVLSITRRSPARAVQGPECAGGRRGRP